MGRMSISLLEMSMDSICLGFWMLEAFSFSLGARIRAGFSGSLKGCPSFRLLCLVLAILSSPRADLCKLEVPLLDCRPRLACSGFPATFSMSWVEDTRALTDILDFTFLFQIELRQNITSSCRSESSNI